MFTPKDNTPVLKLYREPLKEETEDQKTIKELRKQLEEKDQIIARLEKENSEQQMIDYYKEIEKRNVLVKGFVNESFLSSASMKQGEGRIARVLGDIEKGDIVTFDLGNNKDLYVKGIKGI